MKPPDDKPLDDHADERRRQFEESRGLRGRPELPLDEAEDEDDAEDEDADEDEDEESSDDDELDEEQDGT
jgi:hypothetical protein